MRNIKLTVAYRGTNYNGWQRQVNNKSNGVQNVLDKALGKALGEDIETFAASRTDSGVHALGQIVNFHTNSVIPAHKFTYTLRQYLPDDIKILSGEDVASDFHARYNSKGKRYSYLVSLSSASVFDADLAWHVRGSIDFEKMREAAGLFVGEHDFSAFRATGSKMGNPVRVIYNFSVKELSQDDLNDPYGGKGTRYLFEVSGSGFLYKQVRLMVGALVKLGLGKLSYERLESAINSGGSIVAPPAPAWGLTLLEVFYEKTMEK